MTPDEILAAFQRNVRRLDNWRGYIGDDEDSPTDDEVHEVLQRARLALAEPREGTRIAEALYVRVAELERQRDAVLALHRPRVIESLDGMDIVSDFCAYDDEVMPCPTAAIYGGGQ